MTNPELQQAPARQFARGTVSDFYAQPSGAGGPALRFPVLGTSYSGVIARDVSDSDVKQLTDFQTKQPAFYRDGRPKLALVLPIQLTTGPSPEFPSGVADYWVTGADSEELIRAMLAAGVRPGEDGLSLPKDGDAITITYTQDKPGRAGMNSAKVKTIQYTQGGTTGAV
jgi:hypothetical protein